MLITNVARQGRSPSFFLSNFEVMMAMEAVLSSFKNSDIDICSDNEPSNLAYAIGVLLCRPKPLAVFGPPER